MQIRNKACWYLLTAIVHVETDVIQKTSDSTITITTTGTYTMKGKNGLFHISVKEKYIFLSR